MSKFDLSIIIPVLNEAGSLPLLFSDLAGQTGVSFELIVADGDSTDATVAIAKEWFDSGRLSGRCLTGSPGRGRQLNTGAKAATREWLLFIHADCRLHDAQQLQKALTYLSSCQEKAGSDDIAGRFTLSFAVPDGQKGFGLNYYETKARLGRVGCIHGDQGMLMKRSFFDRIGPFREDLPVMEDTSLAEVIRDQGQWVLLPGEIVTSARRFQTEGLKARQTLNALMMNFLTIGWLDFFAHAPELYRRQDKSATLDLKPFFQLVRELLRQLPLRDRMRLWLATGRYVRGQAWQLGLMLDCRRSCRAGDLNSLQNCSWLNRFDRWFDPVTDNLVGNVLSAVLVRAWFACQ